MAARIECEIKLRDYPDVVTVKDLMLILGGVCEHTAVLYITTSEKQNQTFLCSVHAVLGILFLLLKALNSAIINICTGGEVSRYARDTILRFFCILFLTRGILMSGTDPFLRPHAALPSLV